jgi:SNF2 family DNA or RNA helicase
MKAEGAFVDYMKENFSKATFDSAMMAQFLVQRNHLRQLSVKGKMKGIGEWLEDFKEQSNEKVLIVCNYSEPLQILSEYLGCGIIDGSKTAEQKFDMINKWKTNKQQFMLANIKAVGTGTDGLQDNCSTLVVLDLPEKPSTLDQLVGRLERIGQKNFINVYYLLSQLTIDVHLWESIEIKRQITEAINKGIAVEQVDINSLIVKSYLKRL